MMRASPVDLRKEVEVARRLTAAGILFVPMPVLDREDLVRLRTQSLERLDHFIEQIEAEEVQP